MVESLCRDYGTLYENIYYDLWSLFGDTEIRRLKLSLKAVEIKGLSAISVISQGNVWNLR
jgi:hypothetical protein